MLLFDRNRIQIQVLNFQTVAKKQNYFIASITGRLLDHTLDEIHVEDAASQVG
jgi:hypothetical protein